MDKYCRYHLIFGFTLFGCICAARYQYGAISLVGPAFVNREVTLKATPFYPWRCQIEWKYKMDGGTTFQTMNGPNIKSYLEDGSFFLTWTASIEYNRSVFYAGCSTNTTIRTHMVSIDMTGLGHYYLQRKTYNKRTWKKNHHKIQLRKRSYIEGSDSVRPSYPVLGRKYPDFNTTKCIYVYKGSDFYCKTENGTEPQRDQRVVPNQ
ncbi:uncharacterized protein LOC128246214 [Mya arenaria]|uniref:uncharacterized protein LOC128246214 n=1 Tax=Mya arenaria TaxID=6604 RepID=UPI0022E435AE|nr:uncharacterized protein LOC128246214 [Mya arenaria]